MTLRTPETIMATTQQTMTPDALVARLREAYGDALRSVVVYGDAADGAVTDELPLLVIADALPVDALDRAASATREWIAAGHPAPLTLTLAEWRSSADVFAIEYADVIERHRVLYGILPLDGIAVQPADVRRELEEQVLGKLLKLRRGVMEAGGDAGRERDLLAMSVGTFVALFRAVLRLHGERPPADPAAVCERTGARAGFDAAPFARMVRHVRGEAMLQPGDARAALGGFLDGLERLIAHLDAFAPGR